MQPSLVGDEKIIIRVDQNRIRPIVIITRIEQVIEIIGLFYLHDLILSLKRYCSVLLLS